MKLLATTETENQMKSGLLLNIVIRQSTAILKLFTGKDQSLLIWGNTFLVLNLGLNVLNGVGCFNLKGDGLASQGFDENLHTSTEPENQVKGRLLLDVVVREGATILKLLASKDQSLLIWGNSFLILNLSFDIFDAVRSFNLKCNSFASQGFNENLHSSAESKDQVQCRLFLDVIVRKSSAILKLFASKDQSLLIWGNSLLVLNLGLDIFDGVRSLHFQSNGLAGQGFDKNLHTSTKTEDQMQGGFLLDIVVRKSTAVFELFAGKDQSLLIWGNALLILNLSLDILNGVRSFNLKGDGFTSQGLDENLHTSSQTENQMQSRFLLDVVVRKGTAILKLFAGKDQSLLIWGNALLVLDLCFNVLNGVRSLNLKGDGFTGQGLDENLHTSSQTEDQMQGRLLLDVVVRKGT